VNIFVGNLSYDMTETDLRAAFEACGQVASASIIMDRATGRSKGFGFVEMPDPAQAKSAIETLNLKEIKGRSVTVNEARPRESRGPGASGGRGGQRGDRW
jgi:RNA recognition motif-containing protein